MEEGSHDKMEFNPAAIMMLMMRRERTLVTYLEDSWIPNTIRRFSWLFNGFVWVWVWDGS